MANTVDQKTFRITLATAITVIIFLIATTAQTASWKTQMESEHNAMSVRQDQLVATHAELKGDIKDLESQADGRDIQLSEIKVKLANIESLLLDIKQDIKAQS